jgi:GrpB-like predicted nucleotidyltransferase (UPF0157 family)
LPPAGAPTVASAGMGREDLRRAGQQDLTRAGGGDMPIEVVEYDPSWPAAFETERARIAPLLAGAQIHHIGSTSVPGLAAKPVIDMIAVVDSYDKPVSLLVSQAGYDYPEAFNAALTVRRFLVFPNHTRRTHHLHLIDDPRQLVRYVAFRDRLRSDHALALEYEALKRSLAARYRDDRETYTESKTDFIVRHQGPTPAA